MQPEQGPAHREPGRTASQRVEGAFYAWGRSMVRHRWWAIALPLLFSAWALSWLPQLSVDNSTESFLHPDDPATVRYTAFRDQFDRDDRIIVALAPDDVFDEAFLRKLRQFHLAIEERVPYTAEVTSLFNARSTRGEGDELIVEDLLEGWLDAWPEDTSELAGLRERVMGNPLFIHTLVSADADLTTVTLKPYTYTTEGDDEADALAGFGDDFGGEFGDDLGEGPEEAVEPTLLTSKENDALMAALHEVIADFESDDFPAHLGGALAITDHINRYLARDMGVFMSMCFAVIFLLLFVLFRRISGALLPMLVVLLSVLVSIGVMVALDIPGSTAVQILPVFLLTVGVCDAVHILTIVYQRLELGDEKDDAIALAIGHSGLAVLMTSVTTAAGMASFAAAEMAPVAHLGTIAPIGVMLALAYTLVLLPGLLAVFPLPARKRTGDRFVGALTRGLVTVGGLAARRPWPVLGLTAALALFCVAGALQVRVAHYAMQWFEADDPLRVAAELVDQRLRGSMSLEVVVDSGEPGGLHDPDLLARIGEAATWAEGIQEGAGVDTVFVGKAISLVDVVEEIHMALNDNDPAYRVLPDDRALIAQELLLFEQGGTDDLTEIVDTEYRYGRVSLRAPFVDALLYAPFMAEIEAGFRRILGDDVEIEMTGFMPVLSAVVSAVIVSMTRSYAIALMIITPLMMLLLWNLRLGLLAMIPNLLPVLLILSVMGWLSIPIDSTTVIIGAMVIGLAVDDTIHFMHKFRLYFAESGDAEVAVRQTLETTGAALLFTTLVLFSGFAVLMFASMTNTQSLGLLAAIATVAALAADVVVGPALMVLATRNKGALVADPADAAVGQGAA